MAEAERSGDPVVLAVGVRVHAHVLVREKHTAQAVNMVRHTADQLTGSYDQRSPRYLAAVGLLLLRGATAASRNGDRATTQDFLTEAKEAAHHVAFDRPDAWANFNPTNVALHEVSAAVSFGDAGIALQTARPLMRRHIPVPERRAALWVETARAYADGAAELCVRSFWRRFAFPSSLKAAAAAAVSLGATDGSAGGGPVEDRSVDHAAVHHGDRPVGRPFGPRPGRSRGPARVPRPTG
jgi:hypothetical protein